MVRQRYIMVTTFRTISNVAVMVAFKPLPSIQRAQCIYMMASSIVVVKHWYVVNLFFKSKQTNKQGKKECRF